MTTKLPRSAADIAMKIGEIISYDLLEARASDLCEFLLFDEVPSWILGDEEFAAGEVQDWNNKTPPRTREEVIKKIKDYLPFAWDKCNDERGLSARRSIDHMETWFWLLGDEDFDSIDWKYHDYGRAILEQVESFLKKENDR